MIYLIPSYQPSERLPELVAELKQQLIARGDRDWEIIVVDDGSGAEYTALFASCTLAGAEVLYHPKNMGKGAALKTGFAHILANYPGHGVVTADGDGQHTVTDILRIADAVEQDHAAQQRTVVLGCRVFDSKDVPARSRIGNNISRGLFRLAAGWKLSDTQTGLRGFPAAVIPWLLKVPGERFEYEQQMLLKIKAAGLHVTEVPIQTVYLDDNSASHFRPLTDSVRVLAPLLMFTASSLLAFAVDALALLIFNALTGMLTLSIVLARLVSASFNFAVNRNMVFLQRGKRGALKQAIAYAALAVLLLLSNIAWMQYLTGIGVPLLLAKVLTELVLFVLSYHVQRSTIFKSKPEAAAQVVLKTDLTMPAVLDNNRPATHSTRPHKQTTSII